MFSKHIMYIIFIVLPVRAAVEKQLHPEHWQLLSIKIQERWNVV